MARDPNKLFKDVLIKIGNATVLQGSVHYRNDTRFIELKLNPAAPAGLLPTIEAASDQNNLFVNALGAAASNPDFHHKPIRFKHMSGDRKIWQFELL